MRASKQRRVPSALIRPALWFCACNLLAAALPAQCTNPTQVPNGTYTSGDHSQVDNNALSATTFAVSGGASATFSAGNCIQLNPGFHASAIGATAPTTFHAWVDIAPTAISVVPNSPPQNPPLSQSFTWTVSSPSGHSSLSHVFALFNSTSNSTANACYIHYDTSSNLVYLADNTSTTWLGGFVPSGSGSASNSQCTISGTNSSPNPTSSGTQLGLSLNVTFNASSFSGTQNEYLYALDGSGVYTGWQPMGTWTVPAPPAPDFTLTATNTSYYVQMGSSTPSYTLIITPQNGFNNPVSFSISWPMNGCGYPSYNPGLVTGPPWTSTVTMSCNETLQNGYWTQVTATGGGKSHQLILSLYVSQGQQYFLTTAVSPSGGGYISPGSGWYNSGSYVTIAATPASGYHFTGFTGSVNSSSNPLTIAMNGAMTETANFAANTTYYTLTTTANPSSEGSVNPSCAGGCSYTAGSQVTITATPVSGYQFTGFTGSVNSSSNPVTVTMNNAMTETANFVPITTQYQLTTSVSPAGAGATSPSCPGGCMYGGGANVTLTATPNAGYSFSGFSGTVNSSSNPLTVTMNNAVTEAANFASTPPNITTISPTSGPAGTPVTISGSGFGAAQGSSTVTFAGVSASVSSWSPASIVALVPTGASAGAITVAISGFTPASSPTNFVPNTALSILTTALQAATLGSPYSETLTASGGTPPYSWSLLAGSLPSGLALTSSSGTIAGNPSALGTFPLQWR